MAKKIYITQEQYNRLNTNENSKSNNKTVIINENQLEVIREFENNKVLHYEFETKVRKYMEELKNNPCKPKYDKFFTEHDIPEDVLQNKMLDLGLIKKTDKIDEPEDANGEKHSVHSRKFIFSGKNFNDNIDKLYNSFFKNGERLLKETDCGGAIGGDAGFGSDTTSPGGSTTTDSTGDYTYTMPFGQVQRRKIGTSGSTESNIDMEPTSDRTPGKMIVNQIK